MGGLLNDRQIILTRNKAHPDFHAPGQDSMIVDVTPLGGRDKKMDSE